MADIGEMEPILPMDAELIPLIEQASDLRTACTLLLSHVGLESRVALAKILRAMNSYYTNKIEGQHTYPADLENALHSNFSTNTEVKKRQVLALAHMQVEGELEALAQHSTWESLFSETWICQIHKLLYSKLDAESLTILDRAGNPRGAMIPGELRTSNVRVGDHDAPIHEDVGPLLKHFQERYGKGQYKDTTKIVLAGSSLHRLSWIHPFPDGNGRVSRLHNHILLSQMGLAEGLWSPMRGLARRQQQYYGALHQADLPKRNATDGRGELSSKGLADFIQFWLDTCLDQVQFMAGLLSLREMDARYVSLSLQFLHDYGKGPVLHHRSKLRPELLGGALHSLFKAGRMDRGAFKAMLDTSDRTASRVLSRLQDQKLVIAHSKSGPLEPGFPLHSFRFLFPGLWPEAEGITSPPMTNTVPSEPNGA